MQDNRRMFPVKNRLVWERDSTIFKVFLLTFTQKFCKKYAFKKENMM